MLLSLQELMRYELRAIDRPVGNIAFVYFDPTNWSVRYLGVEPEGMFSRNTVLIPPIAIRRIDVDQKVIELHYSSLDVYQSPDAAVESDELKSTDALDDFKICTSQESLGKVKDWIIDTTEWQVNYLHMTSGALWPHRIYLVPTQHIEKIDDNEGEILLALHPERLTTGDHAPIAEPRDFPSHSTEGPFPV